MLNATAMSGKSRLLWHGIAAQRITDIGNVRNRGCKNLVWFHPNCGYLQPDAWGKPTQLQDN
jgi:hypothetical protein